MSFIILPVVFFRQRCRKSKSKSIIHVNKSNTERQWQKEGDLSCTDAPTQ